MMNNSDYADTSSTTSVASTISISSSSESASGVTSKKSYVAKTCVLCDEVVHDNIGVTPNRNRHKTEYDEWSNKSKKLERQQPKLRDFIAKKTSLPSSSKTSYPIGHQREKELHDAIVQNLIIELGLPLSLVERPAFIKFMSSVNPKFSITSRRTLRRTTIPSLYHKMNDLLKEFCSTAEYISLTLDIWSDRGARSFFNKLCRIVTDNASNNIKAFEDLIIPGFDSYFYGDDENNNGSHLSDCNDSGDDLSDNLTISITNSIEVGLDIVKDSFDNLASSSKLRLPCFAHTLQLVVKDGLAEAMCIKQAITKVSKIVKIAHSSATFAEKLEAIGPSIPTANKTRWNSQLYTVQKRLEIQSSQLNLMLIELKRKDTLLMRQHRASMSQTTIQMLTMLKCNSHLL
ncbi:unnamed protein product [Rotaria magnacalcarata]|uniref:Uncharacterized protein n=1 Tax=Rotaria magnacalcarata TaxID=392030 RepID=A0A816SDU6_9BILA|nr:unnamed protein product [Rotaria magnacalcarata]